jgi:HEPN domain-containing protein
MVESSKLLKMKTMNHHLPRNGVPEDYYSEGEAEDVVVKAKRIIEWVEETWRELLGRGES